MTCSCHWLDVLVHAEEIRRVILLLECDEPLVVLAIGVSDLLVQMPALVSPVRWQTLPARFPISSPEESFQKAIEIAQRQQAKSLELQASTSLARLGQQQDRKAEAHKLLANVYNWFTEGFDTADLKEAEALLTELS